MLGDPLEESVCGADSWSLFEESLLYPSDGSFVFPIMAHQKVHFLEIHLRRTTVGPTRGAFLRPYLGWILRSCSLCSTSVVYDVGRDCKEKILSSVLSDTLLMAVSAMVTDEEVD